MSLTEPEAVAAIALLAMYSDEVLAPEEDDALRDHLLSYPLFQDVDEDELGQMLVALEKGSRKDGGEALLAEACRHVGEFFAPTAFYIAVDIIAADGKVEVVESDFLARLRQLLKLPDEQARAITHVVSIARRA